MTATAGALLVCDARVTSLSRPQWREHCTARVVVTATTTWCQVAGGWLHFHHAVVMGYTLTGQSAVPTFTNAEPLQLSGPSVWCHAVLLAYLRYGAPAWQHAPLLHSIKTAAQQLAAEPGIA